MVNLSPNEQFVLSYGTDPSTALYNNNSLPARAYAANIIKDINQQNDRTMQSMRGEGQMRLPSNFDTLAQVAITNQNQALASSVGYELNPTWNTTLQQVATSNLPNTSLFDVSEQCNNCNSGVQSFSSRKSGQGSPSDNTLMIVGIIILILICIFWKNIKKSLKL